VSAFVASVIIVCKDRADDLVRAIGSLDKERAPGGPFEVIAVDDGSADDTYERILERSRRAPPSSDAGPREVVPIRLERSMGPGAARNVAADRARAPLLAFLDSDARALPGWLTALLAPFDDPGVGAAGSVEELDPSEPLAGRVVHFVLTSPWTTGGLRGRAGRRLGRYVPRSFAMAVRQRAFRAAGGFPAQYYGEDIALSHAISRQGLALVLAPDARVHHRRRSTLGAFFRQVHAMGRARAALASKDGAHLEAAYVAPAAALVLFAALALGTAVHRAFAPPLGIALALAWLYTSIVAVAAVHALGDVRALPLAPAFFIAQQLGYATGFLRGWGGRA